MPQDPFAHYAVKPATTAAPQADPFAAYAVTPPKPKVDEGGASGFAREFWKRTNPIEALKGLVHAAGDIPGTVKGLVSANPEFLTQAQDAAGKGDYATALRKVLSYAAMGLGPDLDNQADMLAEGRYAEGAGAMTGMATSLTAPVVAGKVLGGRRVPAAAAPKDPAVARAVASGQAAGVPMDAATATNNPFVRFAQKTSDESLLGSVVGQRSKAAQQVGLAKWGDELAGQASPSPVSPQQAGEAVQAGGRGSVRTARGAADDAYTRLRELEADPVNTATFEPAPPTLNPDAPWSFTMKGKPTVEDIFPEVLKDARANGYTGKVGDLRTKFDARVEQSRGLKAATAEGDEYSHAALLKEIRSRGGLRPYDQSFTQGGPTQKLRGEHSAAQQANAKYYGKNAVYRNDGLETSDMLQQLSEDPKWGHIITPDTDLTDLVHRGAMKTDLPPGNLEHHLRGVGVQPGATWWREGEAAQQVQMAVDITETKAAMRPIYDKLARKKELVGSLIGAEGNAFARLDAILNGPDITPLSVADAALSDLKRMARSRNPDLRSAGAGIAARAVAHLHRSVMEAAHRAGPEAVAALTEGRQATIAKYAAADILKKLEGAQGTKSPVSAFRGMTQAGDASVPHLREVLVQTPAAKPAIGRAVLDGLIDSPTMGPDAAFKAWQRVGPQTKHMLYTPDHIAALDDFFLLRKKIAENPNPSGSGLTVLKGGELFLRDPGLTIALPALSALLHSRAGVALLTKGFRLPSGSKVATTGYAAELSRAIDGLGPRAMVPAMTEEQRQPQ